MTNAECRIIFRHGVINVTKILHSSLLILYSKGGAGSVGQEKANDNGEELYRRFLDGDEKAFEELIGLYRESLTLYINDFVKDMYEAEELMIDVFARLDEERGFKGKSSLKTYLFAMARHLALRHVKKRGRKAQIPIEELVNKLCGGGDSSPEADYLRGERREQLRGAIQQLKPEYGEVLRLLYFENMSYEEAAGIMNKTVKQIDNLTYNAKISLKAMLEGGGFIYEE